MILKEFGEPAVLLENPKSLFYSLVEQTGAIIAAQLKEIAKEVFYFQTFFVDFFYSTLVVTNSFELKLSRRDLALSKTLLVFLVSGSK